MLILALTAFSVFIWPTPYDYTHQGSARTRFNRFTGTAEYSNGNGWLSKADFEASQKIDRERYEEEMNRHLSDNSE